jgi:hypothetical protein
VVECTGLENRSTRKGTVGSNPTLSAKIKIAPARGFFILDRARCVDETTGFDQRHAGRVAQDAALCAAVPRQKRGMTGAP